MRIVDVIERAVPISRYDDPAIPSGGLTTSILALVTDVVREGQPVVGFGFSSIGRFAQSGLVRERFLPRLLAASDRELADERLDAIDPFKAWNVMMKGEKAGGHGERCVAVGTLDMALWDAAAKVAEKPLYRHLADTLETHSRASRRVSVYAGGGYVYPEDDIARLIDEVGRVHGIGFNKFKMKIGASSLQTDLKRVEAASRTMRSPHSLAADAMNAYSPEAADCAARELAAYSLLWFEDVCDPLDLETQARIVEVYPFPIAAGEALFSVPEARLLQRYGGLRKTDILVFDPVHCYGLPGYLKIIQSFEEAGWSRTQFWPHGGHLFSLHVAGALGLGGSELNPFSFQPFGGLPVACKVTDGRVDIPDAVGVGFEAKEDLAEAFHSLQK